MMNVDFPAPLSPRRQWHSPLNKSIETPERAMTEPKCLEFYKRKDLISKTASNVQIREAIYKHSLEKYLPYKNLLDEYGNKYSWFN